MRQIEKHKKTSKLYKMIGSDDEVDDRQDLEKRQKLDGRDQQQADGDESIQSKIKYFEDLKKIKERKEQM